VVSITDAPADLMFSAPQIEACKEETGVGYSLTVAPAAGSTYKWTVIGGSIVGPDEGGITSITVNWFDGTDGFGTPVIPSVSVTESNFNAQRGSGNL
jgi:hypothetical protein